MSTTYGGGRRTNDVLLYFFAFVQLLVANLFDCVLEVKKIIDAYVGEKKKVRKKAYHWRRAIYKF